MSVTDKERSAANPQSYGNSPQKDSAEHESYAGVRNPVWENSGAILPPDKLNQTNRITENNITDAKEPTARLLERILERDNLNQAYKRVKANKGAGGVDKMQTEELLPYLAENGDVEAFDGFRGLFQHRRADGTVYIKVGYHDGLVDSETWLAVQDKKSHNQQIPNNGGAKSSWLVGLTKCSYCGYGLSIYYSWNTAKTKKRRYYVDSGADRANGCVKSRLKIRPDELEQIVFGAMKQRLESLIIAKSETAKPDAETENIKAESIRIDDEIRKLMDKLANADSVLFSYIQERVQKLHAKKSDLDEKLRTKARKHRVIDTAPLTDPMSRWDSLSVNEKHALAVTMIDVIFISDENGIDIRFSI